jgi:hypothetical protein
MATRDRRAGLNLREERKRLGLSQWQAARLLGRCERTIRNWELLGVPDTASFCFARRHIKTTLLEAFKSVT